MLPHEHNDENAAGASAAAADSNKVLSQAAKYSLLGKSHEPPSKASLLRAWSFALGASAGLGESTSWDFNGKGHSGLLCRVQCLGWFNQGSGLLGVKV